MSVYFAQPVAGGPIKIGQAIDVPRRIKQLEAHYGIPLAVLATMEGGREEERAIHVRFARLRFGQTEQFRPAPDLMAFIGRPLLVGANPEAVEAIEPAGMMTIINLKGTPSYVAWLDAAHKKTRLPKATIFRIAVEMWAADHGLEPPPEM